jgi:sulfite exporter TauE/SafE/copper chaperone CopZ
MENLENPQKDKVEFSVHVQGMTCHSCEVLIERSWKNVEGIKDVKADAVHGTVKITSTRAIEKEELQKNLLDQKYKVLKEAPPVQEKRTRPSWSELAGLFALAIGLAWIITKIGGLVSGGPTDNVSLGTALFLGVLASVSSCLAIVSGLMISSTAGLASQETGKTSAKAKPVIMFLAGRVISYTVLGGILGWIGARLAFSSTTTSIILALAAAYMILVGLDMLHLLPASVRRYLPGTPKALTHGVMDKAQKSGTWMPALMGAATFFLPCGFTQALQAYALTTGSFTASAIILGGFAVGTVPGLLVFGLAATSLKGSTGKFLFKVAGALVIVLGVLNLRNGIALAGLRLPTNSAQPSSFTSVIDSTTQEQVVKMTVTDSGYQPSQLVIRTGIPVRWEINNQATGCARSLVASSIGINAVLRPGANIFRFTPSRSGTIPFSCSMGMYRGEFVSVTDNSLGKNTNIPFMKAAAAAAPAKATGSSCGGSGGGCGGCGGGGSAPKPTVVAQPSTGTQDIQVFKLTYDTNNDIQPNTFRVKVGQKVRLEIDAKENGSGCMSTITIPGLYDQIQQLRQGPMTIEFTATSKGSYDITCAMGVPRGQVIVE